MRYSSGDFLGYAVLTLTLQLNGGVSGGASCKDVNGLSYETGFHYIPGPDLCTLCICDNGNPTFCKAVFCKYKSQESSHNKDCKTFRFGNTCCEIICLDDTLSSPANDKVDGTGANILEGRGNYDLALRLIASGITALLSLSLLIFLVHRLRQRKIRVCAAGRQNHQTSEEQRSLGSIGYLDRSNLQHGVPVDNVPCSGGYPLWKPPGNYFPRGEAPPPYEEAVAAARAEQALLSISPHVEIPMNFPLTPLITAHSPHTPGHAANRQNGLLSSSPMLSCNNSASISPLITPTPRPLSSPSAHSNCHQINQTDPASTNACAGTSTSSFAISTNTYENAPTSASIPSIPLKHSTTPTNARLLSNAHVSTAKNFPQHTTLPRQGSAFTISATLPSSSSGGHRTIPRTMATSGSLKLRKEYPTHPSIAPLLDVPPGDESFATAPRSAPPTVSNVENASRTDAFYEDIHRSLPSTITPLLEKKSIELPAKISAFKQPPLVTANELNEEGSFDSVTCTCSTQALPTLHDDADDYRSECENCKSATGSRYYLDNEDELMIPPHETMTLQRRPEDTTSNATPQYYRNSLTLPTSTRQRTRSTGSRGNWFSAMPESSTESSDGE